MADMTAGDVMMAAPRMDVLNIDDPCHACWSRSSTPHSRFPVYQGERDNIIGTLMAKDLLSCNARRKISVRALCAQPCSCPKAKA